MIVVRDMHVCGDAVVISLDFDRFESYRWMDVRHRDDRCDLHASQPLYRSESRWFVHGRSQSVESSLANDSVSFSSISSCCRVESKHQSVSSSGAGGVGGEVRCSSDRCDDLL